MSQQYKIKGSIRPYDIGHDAEVSSIEMSGCGQTVGTCSICGGPVQVPMHWGGTQPPKPRCSSCGAVMRNAYGPTIPMEPAKSDKYKLPYKNSNPDL